MDKEDFYELMIKFIKHTKEYSRDNYDWVIEDMKKNDLFKIFGEDLKEQFEDMF